MFKCDWEAEGELIDGTNDVWWISRENQAIYTVLPTRSRLAVYLTWAWRRR